MKKIKNLEDVPPYCGEVEAMSRPTLPTPRKPYFLIRVCKMWLLDRSAVSGPSLPRKKSAAHHKQGLGPAASCQYQDLQKTIWRLGRHNQFFTTHHRGRSDIIHLMGVSSSRAANTPFPASQSHNVPLAGRGLWETVPFLLLGS